MSSVQSLREFISERLTTAAEEIWTEFEKTIMVHCEEQIDGQSRLLDLCWKPQINLHRTETEVGGDDEEEEDANLDSQLSDETEDSDDWKESRASESGRNTVNTSWSCSECGEQIVHKSSLQRHRTELPQHYVLKVEEVLTDQQLCNQENSSSLDQEEPEQPQKESKYPQQELEGSLIKKEHEDTEEKWEPPQITNEQEDPFKSQDEEQFVPKLETGTLMVSPDGEERDHSEPEPNREKLLFQNSREAENQDQEGSSNEDSGSNREEELKENQEHPQGRNRRDNLNCSKPETHKNILTAEKPFSCQVCGKGFSQRGHLFQHVITHAGEKPFSCQTCRKGFSRRGTLRGHMETHR